METRYIGRNIRNFARLERRLAQFAAADGIQPPELADIYRAQGDPDLLLAPYHVKTGAEFVKWRLIHKKIHRDRFNPSLALGRADQWRRVHDRIAATLGAPEVLTWIAEQTDIALNLEKGIRDMRPRRNCPCHTALLEFVANRKRKALAVYHFALAEVEADPSLDWQVDTEMVNRWYGGGDV